MIRLLLATSGVLGCAAIALGAFGAHALAARLGARGQPLWTLASQYLLVHAAAMLALASVASWCRGASAVGGAMAVGVVLFSGSLYGLALGGPRWLGPITPLGGSVLLLAWGALAVLAGQAQR